MKKHIFNMPIGDVDLHPGLVNLWKTIKHKHVLKIKSVGNWTVFWGINDFRVVDYVMECVLCESIAVVTVEQRWHRCRE